MGKHTFLLAVFLTAAAFCAAPVLLVGQNAGTLDPTFGQAGEVVIQDSSNRYNGGHSVLLPDGRLIVAGLEVGPDIQNARPVFTRLMPDGSLDLSYGVNGQARLDINLPYRGIGKIALTTEGKLIVAGHISGNASLAAFVVRLDTNGVMDPSFGQSGLALLDIPGNTDDYFFTALIKPNGTILLGGSTNGVLLVQLLPDGVPDPSFGTGGIAHFQDVVGGTESIFSLALQADGKILTVGINGGNNMQLIRFQPNGIIDPSFANNGVFTFGTPSWVETAYGVAIQDDQKIMFYGTQHLANINRIVLIRLQPNGSFDPAFGTNGRVFTDLGTFGLANTLVLQPDGKALIGAQSKQNPTNDEVQFKVVRYNPDGSLDANFGNDGQVQTPIYAIVAESADLLLQPDGKIVHTGSADGQLVLWRYLNDLMVGLEETPNAHFHLQCSPNPVRIESNLSWTLPAAAEVRCDLYDLQGKFLQMLLPPTFLPAGQQQCPLNFGSGKPTGTYFLVLRVGQQQQVMRVTKL